MANLVLFSVLAVLALFLIDVYVYTHWRRFVERHPSFAWTQPIYLFLLGLMPAMLPIYFWLYRWWEVEPKLVRAIFFACLTVYYVPKFFIAAFLVVKDVLLIAAKSLWRKLRPYPKLRKGRTAVEIARRVRSRRKFIQRVGWTAGAVPFIVTGYSVVRTLYDFKVHRVDVPIADLPSAIDGVTIAQLSDLHAGSLFTGQPMREAVSLVMENRPDIITVTGDFVNRDHEELSIIEPALQGLSADLGVYGCLGNHDHYANTDQVARRLAETPLQLLVNAHCTLDVDGAQLHIVGTDNTGFNQRYADLPKALAGLGTNDPENEAYVLLAHDPTFWDRYIRPEYPQIDLMLCGHTHGGQIGFELGDSGWSLAKIRYERWAGLYREGRLDQPTSQYLYVNRGIGTVGPPIRFGIRPEVTLLTLRRA